MEEEEEEGSRARSRSRSRSRIRDKSSSAQSEKIAKVARYAPILTVEAQRAGQEDNVEIWRQRLDELLSKDAPKGISKTAARAENRLFNQSSVTETSTLGTTHKRKFLGTSHHLQSKRSKLEAESMSYPTFHYPKSTHTYTTISGFIPVRTPTDGIQNLFFQRPPTGPYPFASLLDRKLELLTEGHVCDRPFPERHVPEIANHMADWWDTYHREASVPRALLQDFLGEAISLEQENWTYNPYAGNCVDIYVPTAASSPDGVSLEYLVFAGGDDHRTLTFLPQGQSTKPAIDSITFRFPILQISVSAARPVPTTSRTCLSHFKL
ncbi:hypothetical protein DFS34DRAFT_620568 [Phlyctochytrium arcticum]|nr:hypothetical protein DFS34DRAFT_620568 [Phlyctochytrium arcticum]